MGSNLAKLNKAGPNRAKHLPNRVKQGQARLRVKRVRNGAKQGQMEPDGVKHDQKRSNVVKSDQMGSNRRNRAKQG